MADRFNGGYHITNEILFEHIERLRVQVGDLATEVKLGKQATMDAREERTRMQARMEKVEGRLNGVFVGLGTGVMVGIVWFLRGTFS